MTSKTFFASLLLIAAIITAPFISSAQKGDTDYKPMAQEINRLINKHRTDMGLKPMILNDVVSQIAEGHSKNMATKKVEFSHIGMDERVAKANKILKQNALSWAENVATGQRSAQSAVDSWLKSPGHRENLEGDYNQTGIGIARSPEGALFFTQIFIKKQ